MDPRWPDSVHGLRLGSRVYGKLPSHNAATIKSSAAICCTCRYNSAICEGPLIVIASFLNSVLIGMRAEFRNGLKSSGDRDLTDTLLARLEELGFIFCKKGQQIKLLRLAITTYKSIYGDLNIPKVLQLSMFFSV